ncbi:hypothetical protein EZV62_018968 [Acer yangbiense]|uniref:Wall-associated receptor kinase galacturonan-binding domain-containing protein n=1 Tax=Acer yangbiense TaxID=1000413 RepID=A0A5C7HB08_9ROSI|nr:hypothetical protein EZV62_018968 [Acer yangbiense]
MIPPWLPFVIILLLWPLKPILAQPPSPSTKCTSKCGNVTIPFPFGIEESCAVDGFFKVDCNSSKPYLREIDLEVLDFSLDGTMRVIYSVYNTCDPTLNVATANLKTTPFIFSQTKNRILGVGCGNFSFLSNDDSIMAQCSPTCGKSLRYCQSTIGSPLKGFAPFIETSPDDQECHYAALVEQQFVEQNLKNPEDLRRLTHVPVVLEWSILARYFDLYARNKSKAYESTSTCERSACSCFSSDSPTVRCNCLRGFQGNPYFLDGCQDIDECATNTTNICGSQNCENFIGGYNCYSSPRSKSEELNVNMIILGLSTSFGSLFLLIGAWWLYTKLTSSTLITPRDMIGVSMYGLPIHPENFTEIVKGLTTKQRECIEDMGFGVLLNINCLVFHLLLSEMLLKSIAPETKEIVLHGKSIPMRESDFEKVIGLPNGNQEVKCDMGEFDETCIRMKNLLIKRSKNAITLSSLMKKLKTMKDADDVFMISFVLFTICTLLCPPESSKIDQALFTQLKDPRLIRHKKWATYCFLYLMDGVRKFKDEVSRNFQGCIPFLQIFYWGCIS